MLENDVELAQNRILKDKVNPGSLTHKQHITCISLFSCTNLLYIYKMGMKSLFVQLNNSVVIAFITDHTAKSGILQILTKNQRIHVLHAVIFHLQNIIKEIHASDSLKKFCQKKNRNVILTTTRTYVINALLLFVEGLAEEMQDSSSVNCLA